MDRKLQYKHHLENAEAKRDKRRAAQNGRKDTNRSHQQICIKCAWVQIPQSAGEMKILNSAVTKQCYWGQNKCRQLLIALKPLFLMFYIIQ